MKFQTTTYLVLFALFVAGIVSAQDFASMEFEDAPLEEAYGLAAEGRHQSAGEILSTRVTLTTENVNARYLLASTYSWAGQYGKARGEFNILTSKHKDNRAIWISAVKNELYAKEHAIALGLANKALQHIVNDTELIRLRALSLDGLKNISYGQEGWYNQETGGVGKKGGQSVKASTNKTAGGPKAAMAKTSSESEDSTPKNRLGVSNAFTVFNERYDPVIFSSVTYRHETKIGNIIPRLNYSNRLGKHGLQYDIDFYPKFLKRFYAYVNYGYSNASIYPKHKFGADVYMNLPNAIEVSAGGRYISNATSQVKAITNSLGYYTGNYYLSLRSFVSPREGNLWSISGNLLARKYFRDGENFLGVSVGMGFTPELRQNFAGEELLAETVLFVESQRLNIQYQFTPLKSPNLYRANLGVRRQELSFDSGSFFWAISGGITYEVKF
ncbi:YaiO family outer membrane beta-barrel protein [uncultured Croceitalea sp.]|uniref:YaiO family outer membrane beta-barrel protein n=1 Tax=uncultured Croceitalea sp. TaxID=1798908 RepID=UPI003306577B